LDKSFLGEIKPKKMIPKKINPTYFVITACLLFGNSCSENTNQFELIDPINSTTKLSMVTGEILNYTFDGSEGDAIGFELADRWIANYADINTNKISSHYFGKGILTKMLSQTESIGIRFYYSINDNGAQQLIAVPVDGKENDLSLQYESIGSNSPQGLESKPSTAHLTGWETDSITFENARSHINNFSSSHPKGIVAHFFGMEILGQLLSQNNCIGIRCYYALDEKGVQQLLLIGVTGTGANILRTHNPMARESDGAGIIADVSSPCPALCSKK
jgi:hypothetical protein